MAQDNQDTPEKIKQAFEAHHQALDALEKAILEGFENQGLKGTELLSIQQVCQQLSAGRSWVYQEINSGKLPSVQLGGNLRVKREDLEAYIQKCCRVLGHIHTEEVAFKETPPLSTYTRGDTAHEEAHR